MGDCSDGEGSGSKGDSSPSNEGGGTEEGLGGSTRDSGKSRRVVREAGPLHELTFAVSRSGCVFAVANLFGLVVLVSKSTLRGVANSELGGKASSATVAHRATDATDAPNR